MTRQNKIHRSRVLGQKRKKLVKKTVQRKINRGITIVQMIYSVDRYRTFVRAQIKELIHRENAEGRKRGGIYEK